MKISYRRQPVGDVEVFYREAGPADAPVVLLLHGFPTASHMFRDLMPRLAGPYRVIAPDLPGFGNTKAPPRGAFDYTFDGLAEVIGGFVDALHIERFAMYVFDYGAPVGYRMAMVRPERIAAIVCQNGNAYLEGLSDGWGAWMDYWRNPTDEHREACRASFSEAFIRDGQYLHGADATLVAPDGYTLDLAYLARDGAKEIQLDLILDYRTNVERYGDFQRYFREHRPPLLAVWGRHDEAFRPEGAQAYQRDIPDAQVHLLDTGHFALETHAPEIAALSLAFLSEHFAGATS
jgi:pimeloyl-ACP methyl ester carboxylesterase